MNARILNRDFQHPADGWYHIEPAGEHPNSQAGVVQVIDGEATTSIVNRFNAAADAGQLPHGNEMLIDHEHFSHDAEQETRAFGWLTRLQNRQDGIYGQVRWTTTGKAAVDGGDYRFFSTEYDPEDLAILNRSSPKKVRPLALSGLTLTNRPNNKGARPITNRDPNTLPDNPANLPARSQADTKNKMKLIASKLGLSADASEEGILGEIDKLLNRANGATQVTTERDALKNRVTELVEANKTLATEQCEALMDAHGIAADDKVRNRLLPVLAGLKNRAERIETLADFGYEPGKPAEAAETRTTQTQLRNRDGKAPNKGKTEQSPNSAGEQQKAQKIMNRASELRKQQPGLSHPTAVIMAQREIEGE